MAEKQREEQELFCLQQKALIDQQQENMQTVSLHFKRFINTNVRKDVFTYVISN